ncbi:MAG: SH3 domain-containing protein [Muribaculaceae bacterium]|nr:SH3 domain-containing protein [Roseburia sp.]MCM1430170.1 SH3 domain-containing protein [Muribaculaceae bacterium]MCM1493100.1 SH3 domain-containing protein [Muribaculaceae bacterium]
MKKSHRKDVIIARVIFAAACLLLIAAIVGAVFLVRKKLAADQPDTQDTQASQSTEISGAPTEDTGTETETEPEPEPKPVMCTTTGVNLRAEPNTECEVLTVLTEGTQLELIGQEQDGSWAIVDYQGQVGYVSMDYLEEVTSQTETEE